MTIKAHSGTAPTRSSHDLRVNLNVCTQVQRNTNNALSRKRSMSPENYCNTRKGLRLQLVADRRRFENRFRKFERKIKQTWCVYRNSCR